MPYKPNEREYRALAPFTTPDDDSSDELVLRGTPIVFDTPTVICEIDGVTLINSGSLRLPAGEGGSYCYMVVHKDKVTPVIVGDHLWG